MEKLVFTIEREGKRFVACDCGPAKSALQKSQGSKDQLPLMLFDQAGSPKELPYETISTIEGRLCVLFDISGLDADSFETLDPASHHGDGKDLAVLAGLFAGSGFPAGYLEGNFSRLVMVRCGSKQVLLPLWLRTMMEKALVPEATAELVAPYHCPSPDPETRFRQGAAAWAWHILTGRFPYEARDTHDLAWARAHGLVDPPEAGGLVMDKKLEQALRSVLKDGSRSAWHEACGMLMTRSSAGDLTRPALEGERQKGLAERKKNRSREARRKWLQRHSTRLMVGGIAAAVFLTIFGTMLAGWLEPPRTVGLGPEEVARGFYLAATVRDLEYLDDALESKKDVGLYALSENLYVVTRMREATERRQVLFTPEEWKEAGSPALEDGQGIYGAEGLAFRYFDKNSDGTYRAGTRYRWYDPWAGQAEAPSPLPQAVLKEDDFTLVQKDGTWRIRDYRSTIVPESTLEETPDKER